MTMKITSNDQVIEVMGEKSILDAALDAGVYIPHLCSHPQLSASPEMRSLAKVYQKGEAREGEEGSAFQGCNLCLVEVEGRQGPVQSCKTPAENGMSVRTESEGIQKAREENLVKILVRHPHACLVCAQAQGCDRKICSLQTPEAERCCFKFGMCELQKVAEFIGLEKGLPPYEPQGFPLDDREPLFRRDYNLCIGCLRCVKVCKEVKGADALGFTVQEGRVVVGSKAPTLRESGCQFCGFCVEVCPTGALADKIVRSGERESYLVPCKNQCPAGIDVPRYVRLIAEGRGGEAAAVVREKVPFPGVLGHVCYHPCEQACRRGEVNGPIAICSLKGFAAKNDDKAWRQKCKAAPPTGKRVAVVGSGPAGLTAAYYLAKLGHSVKVFEALDEAGGMMRTGISDTILPRAVLDEEISAILDLGVQIETGTRIEGADELLARGYEAVFVAVGAPHRKFNQVLSRNPEILKNLGLGEKGFDRKTLATSRKGIFAGGDVARGPAIVRKRRASVDASARS